jgi:hypothetical protein
MSTAPTQRDERSDELNFWLGRWDLTREGGQGIHHIEAILDGRMILERFEAQAQPGLKGMSVSVQDERQGCWRQTWVDNQGVPGFQRRYAGRTHDPKPGCRDRWAASTPANGVVRHPQGRSQVELGKIT